MELTSSLRKFIVSLGDARSRREQGCFVAEGTKCVCDTFNSFQLRVLVATRQWCDSNPQIVALCGDKLVVAGRRELERVSSLSTAADVIAVYEHPVHEYESGVPSRGLVVVLDGVQDPGNVGTIIRAADWFGVHDVWVSTSTADAYSPKAIMATMGAISRCRICRGNLVDMINKADAGTVAGTFLDGDNIYTSVLPQNGIIVFGNEGRGISSEVEALITQRLTIPSYPVGAVTSESLNVGMAASITIAEFRRRIYG